MQRTFLLTVLSLLVLALFLWVPMSKDVIARPFGYNDVIHLTNGSLINGKITGITGGIILVKTPEGRQRINRTQVINNRDEIKVGWIATSKKQMIGNVYYLTDKVVEIQTENGKFVINKHKVKSIVLGYPLMKISEEQDNTIVNPNNLLIEKDFSQEAK